jgi:2-methylisocitrate lyase-like PEP mutase family enzyme
MAVKPLPPTVVAAANGKSRRLRELIAAPEILVMPGAWDPLSAILFEHLGFEAVQGGSAAIAAMLGHPDGEVISREQTVEATGALVAAVSVPVNADGERGYGGPEETAVTVRAFVEAGAAGMNLEDSLPSDSGRGLASIEQHLEKIAAVMEAKRALASEFFLNARVDVFAIMRDDPKAAIAEAIRRGNAYAEAGGDCIFYLAVTDREAIGTLVKEVAAPVSVFGLADTPSVAELQELGVARVSYGSAFHRAALAGLKRFAERIREPGGHALMRDVMSGRELQEMLRGRGS